MHRSCLILLCCLVVSHSSLVLLLFPTITDAIACIRPRTYLENSFIASTNRSSLNVISFYDGFAYDADDLCEWIIVVPPSFRIEINFQLFQIAMGDYVEIWQDCPGLPDMPCQQLVIRLAGASSPSQIIRSSGTTSVKFVSMPSTKVTEDDTGFRLSFTVTNPRGLAMILATNSSGQLSSPTIATDGTSLAYPPNIDAFWKVIAASADQVIKFAYIHLDIDRSDGCIADAVGIYDGSSEKWSRIMPVNISTSSIYGWICNNFSPTTAYNSTENTALVHFYSDSANHPTKTGFQLQYDVVRRLDHKKLIGIVQDSPRLIAFWPLNDRYGLVDVISSSPAIASPDAILSTSSGPFGDKLTAYVAQSNNGILSVKDVTALAKSLRDSASFTIAFYLSTTACEDAVINCQGGILQFYDDDDDDDDDDDAGLNIDNELAVEFVGQDIIVWGHNTSQSFRVLAPNQWNFVAISFDGDTNQVSVFGKFGSIYTSRVASHLRSSQTYIKNGLIIGASKRRNNNNNNLPAHWLLSCVQILNVAIGIDNAFSLREACRNAHGQSQCGLKRVGSANSFPWIASLRNGQTGEHHCMLTILSESWLVGSAACLTSKSNLTEDNAVVYTGINAQGAIGQSKRNVRRFIKHYQYDFLCKAEADIILIEVAEPFDMSSPDINTMCLSPRASDDFTWSSELTSTDLETGRRIQLSIQVTTMYAKDTVKESSGKIEVDTDCLAQASRDAGKPDVVAGIVTPDLATALCTPNDIGSPVVAEIALEATNNQWRRFLVGIFDGRPAGFNRSECGELKNNGARVTLLGPLMNWIEKVIACDLPGVEYPINCPRD